MGDLRDKISLVSRNLKMESSAVTKFLPYYQERLSWRLRGHFSEFSISNVYYSLGVVNLEMENSLKWLLFNTVSGQTTSDEPWK